MMMMIIIIIIIIIIMTDQSGSRANKDVKSNFSSFQFLDRPWGLSSA